MLGHPSVQLTHQSEGPSREVFSRPCSPSRGIQGRWGNSVGAPRTTTEWCVSGGVDQSEGGQLAAVVFSRHAPVGHRRPASREARRFPLASTRLCAIRCCCKCYGYHGKLGEPELAATTAIILPPPTEDNPC
jgi:hypothetical protein